MTTLPVPAGPVTQIYTDYPTYAAFPVTYRCADGTALLIYRGGEPKSTGHFVGPTHLTVTACVWLMRQPADQSTWWSAPSLIGPFGVQVVCAGLTGEDAASGGRVLAAGAVNGVSGSLYSDDSGATWTTTVAALPASPSWQVSGQPCWQAGTFYLPTYGPTSVSVTTPIIRVYASTDRGLTWTLRSTVGVTGRQAQEPAMLVLADGRLGLLVRSDGATTTTYDYIFTATSSDGGATWTTMAATGSYPGLQIAHASGQPYSVLLADGRVLVVHRGKTETVPRGGIPTNTPPTPAVWSQPVAVTLLDPGLQKITNAAGKTCLQYLDLVDGDPRFMLYGGWLPGIPGVCPDRLIWSAHNGLPSPDLNNDNATATLYEREIDWLEVGT